MAEYGRLVLSILGLCGRGVGHNFIVHPTDNSMICSIVRLTNNLSTINKIITNQDQ